MTREMQKRVKEKKERAAALVRYAAPKNGRNMKNCPTLEEVKAILAQHIPYRFDEGKPIIASVEIAHHSKNTLIEMARFTVELANGKVWEIDAHKLLKDVRTPEEKEADKTATFPSGLFCIFHNEIK